MPIANNAPYVYPDSPAALNFPFLRRPSLSLFFILASKVCLSLFTMTRLYLSTSDNDFCLAFSVRTEPECREQCFVHSKFSVLLVEHIDVEFFHLRVSSSHLIEGFLASLMFFLSFFLEHCSQGTALAVQWLRLLSIWQVQVQSQWDQSKIPLHCSQKTRK